MTSPAIARGEPLQIVILGAGGVGLYYGGLLARAGHEVTLFARGTNLIAIRERGLEVRTPEETFTVAVSATDRPADLPRADFAVVAVKSYSLVDVAPVARDLAARGVTIVPLLNGVEAADTLCSRGVPAGQLVGGLTRISAVRSALGVVERLSPFQVIVVGEFDRRMSDRVSRIAAAFRTAGADARSSDHIVVELWQKFVFLAALAAVCGLCRSPVGAVRSLPLGRHLFERAVDEVVAVARARGVALPEDEATRVLGLFDALPAGLKPSFLLDLEAGGPTELDILSGAVSRFGAEGQVPTPVHDTAAVALALATRR